MGVAIFATTCRILRAMQTKPTFEKVLEVVGAALGNPYEPGLGAVLLRARSQGNELFGTLPARDSSEVEWIEWAKEWSQWFGEVVPLAACVSQEAPAEAGGEEIARCVRRIADPTGLPDEWAELACRALRARVDLDAIVGDSSAIRQCRGRAWTAAFGPSLAESIGLAGLLTSTPVLIRGETGTGKELVARALRWSVPGTYSNGRWTPPVYEAINLASIPESLVAAELFGHEKGAFTGAVKARAGILERTTDGVVLLDEIAEVAPSVQVSLLRALQDGRIRRVGADSECEARPRVISATHRDLEAAIEAGSFRRDLFHRLTGATVRTPALRDRLEDLLPLAEMVLAEVAGGAAAGVRERVEAALRSERAWSGNVRELQALVRQVILGLPTEAPVCPAVAPQEPLPEPLRAVTWTLRELQRWYATRAMDRLGSQAAASRRLGVHRETLARYVCPEKKETRDE